MPGNFRQHKMGFFYWDPVGSGTNHIPPYQCVSLASAAEVSAAQATGRYPNTVAGDIVVPTPISSNLPTRRIVGVTDAAQFTGNAQFQPDLVQVIVGGVAKVQAAAAITWDEVKGLVTATLAEARTSVQTPFTNNFDMLLPFDPRVALTYNLSLISALSITPQSGSANVAYYPLGFMIEDASAKYDIVAVDLDCPRVVWA